MVNASAVPLSFSCRLPAGSLILSGGVPYGSSAVSQKQGTVSYHFVPVLHCPPLAAMFDDQREEFSRVGSGV